MYKYLLSNLICFGMVILVMGFVNPGKVNANDEPSNGCKTGLSADGYLEKSLFHINRGTERLKKIPEAEGTLIHSAGYKTAGEWLVRAYQHMSCAKILTEKKIVETKDINTDNIVKTEMALRLVPPAVELAE